jgi:hypothetical protein
LTACFCKSNLMLLGYFFTFWTFHVLYFNSLSSPLPIRFPKDIRAHAVVEKGVFPLQTAPYKQETLTMSIL